MIFTVNLGADRTVTGTLDCGTSRYCLTPTHGDTSFFSLLTNFLNNFLLARNPASADAYNASFSQMLKLGQMLSSWDGNHLGRLSGYAQARVGNPSFMGTHHVHSNTSILRHTLNAQ